MLFKIMKTKRKTTKAEIFKNIIINEIFPCFYIFPTSHTSSLQAPNKHPRRDRAVNDMTHE